MNPTIAAVVVACAVSAAIWSAVRAGAGARSRASAIIPAMLTSLVIAWLTTGIAAWMVGTAPARPGVFAGYAVTAAAIVPAGWSYSARVAGRRGALGLTVAFAMAAFLCYRAQEVWTNPR